MRFCLWADHGPDRLLKPYPLSSSRRCRFNRRPYLGLRARLFVTATNQSNEWSQAEASRYKYECVCGELPSCCFCLFLLKQSSTKNTNAEMQTNIYGMLSSTIFCNLRFTVGRFAPPLLTPTIVLCCCALTNAVFVLVFKQSCSRWIPCASIPCQSIPSTFASWYRISWTCALAAVLPFTAIRLSTCERNGIAAKFGDVVQDS